MRVAIAGFGDGAGGGLAGAALQIRDAARIALAPAGATPQPPTLGICSQRRGCGWGRLARR